MRGSSGSAAWGGSAAWARVLAVPRPVRVLWAVGGAGVLALLTPARLLAPAVLVPLELLGIGLSIRSALAGRLPRRVRLAWVAVAAAFVVLVASGVAFGLASGLGLDRPAGYSALMVMYLVRILLAPLLLAAVFSFPAPPLTRRELTARLLDLMMIVGFGLMAAWLFVIGPALRSGDVQLALLAGVAVPVENLVLAGGCWTLLARMGDPRFRRQLRMLLMAGLLLIPPDLDLSRQVVQRRIDDSSPVLVFSVGLGILLMTVAAAEQVWGRDRAAARMASRDDGRRTASAWADVAPYVAVVAGYTLLGLAAARSGFYPWGGLVIGTVLMTSGMLVRQVLTGAEQRRLARTDPMTGLANRAAIGTAVDAALARSARTGLPAAVMVFDLDGFKQVNDTIGHEAGDALLVGFARVLRNNLLGKDVVGRLGGDEFVVVLSQIKQARDAVAVAERLLEEAATPVIHGPHRLQIATSIGIALALPSGDSREAALHRADQAMYQAKKAGGQTWRVWTADLGEPADAAGPVAGLKSAAQEPISSGTGHPAAEPHPGG